MADVFEEQTEQTVSLNEYLDEVEDRELYHLTFWGTFLNDNMVIYIKEADLVLGGDDGKECTYNKGHMKRQAIFSCITCTPDGNAGVCTACSLSCHEDHEIIELWTKRNFKCDCGNSKFGAFYCKLLPSKDVENVDNSYNHNFKGQYCTCDRPYPDPNIQEQVEMIQCCICEDWFHEEHLGLESSNEIPRDEEGEPLYEELICQMCSKTCSFLYLYPPTILAPNKQNIDIGISKGKSVETSPLASGSFVNLENGSSSELDTIKDGPRDKGTSLGDKPKKCLLGDDLLATAVFMERTGPMFLSKNWRGIMQMCKVFRFLC
ncbi:hypothetical protein L6452_16343 [Arctium lappa]|uniref:Uncharacterized protein n=1 Tax=Arctium lappa TaxID=4217 RepID=A0ACB9C0I1_ARCLA|nr:hypothetical protein L6452_16343 [Arctium lappa]